MTKSDLMLGKKNSAAYELRSRVEPLAAVSLSDHSKADIIGDIVQIILLDIPCEQSQREFVRKEAMKNFELLLVGLREEAKKYEDPSLKKGSDQGVYSPEQINAVYNVWNKQIKIFLDSIAEQTNNLVTGAPPKKAADVIELSVGGYVANLFKTVTGTEFYRFGSISEEAQANRIANITESLVRQGNMTEESAASFRGILQAEFKGKSWLMSAEIAAGTIDPNDIGGESIVANTVFDQRYKPDLIKFTENLLAENRRHQIKMSVTGIVFQGPQNV